MTLRPRTDVGVADWFVSAEAEWNVLATQGPPGFAAYAAVWFDGEETAPYRADDELMAQVVELVAGVTSTTGEVFYGLWDGWGDLYDGGRIYQAANIGWLSRLLIQPTAPRIRPALEDPVMSGPRVGLAGYREYILFSGSAAQVGHWPTVPVEFDVPQTLPPASITWPQDRSWFIAADVDPEWLCIGGSAELIAHVLADERFDAEPVSYGELPKERSPE